MWRVRCVLLSAGVLDGVGTGGCVVAVLGAAQLEHTLMPSVTPGAVPQLWWNSVRDFVKFGGS